MGQWFVTAVAKNDINSVSAVVTFTAVLVLLSGFLADIILVALDPRVRSR
jgi:peptide/nickel transport system permease protein